MRFGLLLLLSLLPVFTSTGQAAQGTASSAKLERVRLQLKWYHQFQFAGYYIAKEKGYYAAEGIDVELVEADASTKVTQEVDSGRAQYGVNTSDILVSRSSGTDVVALCVIFQHSPLVLLSTRDDITAPTDLIGRRVMVSPDTETEILAMLRNESVPLESITFMPHSWKLEDLVQGRVDAITAYSTNEALTLAARGIGHRMIRPLTYGIDFYGDCLFTSGRELREHPARAEAFLRASQKGWEYAMEHADETATLIFDRYSKAKGVAELRAEAAAIDELIVHKFIPIGSMNPGRWRHIADTYARFGVVPEGFSLEGFLYDPRVPQTADGGLRIIIIVLGLVALLALVYSVNLFAFNRRLASEVGARTRTLEALNVELGREVEERRVKEAALAASLDEKVVLLREIHHRVKNNLQVIDSLISIELDGFEDGRQADSLLKIRNRIYGMSLVHENLYQQGSLSRIYMHGYLTTLVLEIVDSWSRPGLEVSAAVEARGFDFPLEIAIPVGLIAGELVSNSMKHAFVGRDRGGISVSLAAEGDLAVLRVVDDGRGDVVQASARIVEGGREEGSGKSGVGLSLVNALAAQLRGRVSRMTGGGFSTRVEFPVQGPVKESSAS